MSGGGGGAENPNSLANLKPFQAGNPGGPGREPGYRKQMREYTKKHICKVFNEMCEMTVNEIEKIGSDKDETELRSIVARVMMRCRAKGEFGDLNMILDRIIGKVPQKTELTGEDGSPLVPATIVFMGNKPKPIEGDPGLVALPAQEPGH